MTSEKVREDRLRRVAQRQGVQLNKSRRRDPLAVDYGQYFILGDPQADERGGLSLDQVERLLLGYLSVKQVAPLLPEGAPFDGQEWDNEHGSAWVGVLDTEIWENGRMHPYVFFHGDYYNGHSHQPDAWVLHYPMIGDQVLELDDAGSVLFTHSAPWPSAAELAVKMATELSDVRIRKNKGAPSESERWERAQRQYRQA